MNGGVEVPFPFEITGDGAGLQGSFFNGERRISSTEAKLDGSADLPLRAVASSLELTVKEGRSAALPAGAR